MARVKVNKVFWVTQKFYIWLQGCVGWPVSLFFSQDIWDLFLHCASYMGRQLTKRPLGQIQMAKTLTSLYSHALGQDLCYLSFIIHKVPLLCRQTAKFLTNAVWSGSVLFAYVQRSPFSIAIHNYDKINFYSDDLILRKCPCQHQLWADYHSWYGISFSQSLSRMFSTSEDLNLSILDSIRPAAVAS